MKRKYFEVIYISIVLFIVLNLGTVFYGFLTIEKSIITLNSIYSKLNMPINTQAVNIGIILSIIIPVTLQIISIIPLLHSLFKVKQGYNVRILKSYLVILIILIVSNIGRITTLLGIGIILCLIVLLITINIEYKSSINQ